MTQPTSDIIEEGVADFRRQYKEAYRGILSDEVLAEGNTWFEDFLRSFAN